MVPAYFSCRDKSHRLEKPFQKMTANGIQPPYTKIVQYISGKGLLNRP